MLKRWIKFDAGCLLAALSGFVAGPLQADVKMPPIFGDHMVLKQEAELPVWARSCETYGLPLLPLLKCARGTAYSLYQ